MRNDSSELLLKAQAFGLTPHLPTLSATSFSKASLMAFRPGLWGLQVWISGENFFLLDEKGFVCQTDQMDLTILLISFESKEGPGAVRTLLSREILSPTSAVKVLTSKFNPKAEVPSVKPEPAPRPLRRRKLSDADFAALLKDL